MADCGLLKSETALLVLRWNARCPTVRLLGHSRLALGLWVGETWQRDSARLICAHCSSRLVGARESRYLAGEI